MAVQESATRISQLLPSINCADCGETVEFRKLGEHICKAAPAVPELPSVYKNNGKKLDENLRDNRSMPRSPSPYDATPSPTDSGYSSYSSKYPSPPSANSSNGNKPFLPFMQKYQQATGKPVNSPSQTPSEPRDRINGSNYSSKFSSNSDNFDEVMQKTRPHDAYGSSNESRGQRQDRYLRGPNDVYNNDRDHMYREEERSRSRSPAGYDRADDRTDYGLKYSQPSLNQSNGTYKHSQEKNNIMPPYVPPLFNKGGKDHRKNESSLSSLSSSASGRARYPDMTKGISDDSKELFEGGFDDLMEDLMREMDNMQTPSSRTNSSGGQHLGHVKNKSSSGRKEVHICAYCNSPIDSSPMWALNKAWHSYHLLCTQCHKPIDPNVGHVEKNEKTCSKPFPDKSFYVFNNAPYCKRHYHKLNNSLCRNCDDAIEGPCAQTIEGWRYHP
ncbi:18828_t:CDS:2, partial [Gigaspora rosea]